MAAKKGDPIQGKPPKVCPDCDEILILHFESKTAQPTEKVAERHRAQPPPTGKDRGGRGGETLGREGALKGLEKPEQH
jgi:hypothetical protein